MLFIQIYIVFGLWGSPYFLSTVHSAPMMSKGCTLWATTGAFYRNTTQNTQLRKQNTDMVPHCVAFGCNFQSKGNKRRDFTAFLMIRRGKKNGQNAWGRLKLSTNPLLYSLHFSPVAFSRPQLLKELTNGWDKKCYAFLLGCKHADANHDTAATGGVSQHGFPSRSRDV